MAAAVVYKQQLPPRKAVAADLMQEKLKKWQRMKGRKDPAPSRAAVNRSRPAVVLTDMSASLNRFEERKIKGLRRDTQANMKPATKYKRISDHSSKLTLKAKRRKTLADMPSLDKEAHHNTDANRNTHKDKTLSMRERLELWRSEKRKNCPGGANQKSEKVVKRLTQVPDLKENTAHYCKLDNGEKSSVAAHRDRESTTRRKSRKSYVIPSAQKRPLVKSSKYEKLVNTSVAKEVTINIPEDKERSEVKSYRDKTLDMSERLELWLAAKGKTPKFKTPANLKERRIIVEEDAREKKRLSFTCDEKPDDAPCATFGAVSPEADEGENVEERLQECLRQLENEDCKAEAVAARLDLYNSSCPHTAQIAFYWLCRAKIAEKEQDYDRVVCLFEQAFVFNAQPESLIKDAVCTFVKFMKENEGHVSGSSNDSNQIPLSSPVKEIPTMTSTNSPDKFNSSVIKFCLTEATPYRKRFKATFGKPVLTPVRRSVRLEHTSTRRPTMLQEHNLTVRKLGELPQNVQGNVFFKPNFAVQAELNEAWNELQWNEDGVAQ